MAHTHNLSVGNELLMARMFWRAQWHCMLNQTLHKLFIRIFLHPSNRTNSNS